MAGEIGSKIIGFAMEKAFEELSQSVLGDKPIDFASEFNSIRETIIASENRVKNHIDWAIQKAAYEHEATKIQGACRLLAEYSEQNAKGNSGNYIEQAQTLYNNKTQLDIGLNSVLSNIHAILTKENDSLFATFVKDRHDDLASDDESKDIASWYLKEIDNLLTGTFCIQLYGLALQVFMCSQAKENKEKEIKDYKSNMWKRFQEQKTAAYTAMHPLVRQLKRSYDEPINWARMWRIESTVGERVLFRDEAGDLRIEPRGPGGDTIWRLLYGQNLVWVQTASEHNIRVREYDYSNFGRVHGHYMKVGTDHPFQDLPLARDSYPSFHEPYDLRTKIAPSKKLVDNKLIAEFRFVKPSNLRGNEKAHWLWENEFRLSTDGIPGSFQPEGYRY